MSTYTLSEGAAADLREVLAYTLRQWGRRQADTYRAQLHQCMAAMAAGDTRTRQVRGADGVYLQRRCRHHQIVAIPEEGGLIVLGIFYERMNIPARIAARRRAP